MATQWDDLASFVNAPDEPLAAPQVTPQPPTLQPVNGGIVSNAQNRLVTANKWVGNLQTQFANIPHPGGLAALVYILLVMWFVLIPVNTNHETRLQLVWDVLLGQKMIAVASSSTGSDGGTTPGGIAGNIPSTGNPTIQQGGGQVASLQIPTASPPGLPSSGLNNLTYTQLQQVVNGVMPSGLSGSLTGGTF